MWQQEGKKQRSRSSLTTSSGEETRRTEHTSTSHKLAFYVSPWPAIRSLPDYQHSSQTSPAFTWHMTVFTTECTNKLTGTVTRHKLCLFTSAHQHTQHAHNVDWVKCCHSRYWLLTRESSRGRLYESQHEYTNNRLHCVNSSSTACQRRLTTELLQTHNTHLLPLWRDATIRSSSTIPTTASTTCPGYSPRVSQPIDDSTISRSSSTFQEIDDSTLSRSRGPSSIHVPSNRRQHTIRLPSNRREHKVFSKQSTRAQSLRLPSNRREHKVFVFQAIDERSSTNTLNDEQREKDNWPRAQLTTHSPTTPTSSARCTLVRSHCTHARATRSPYKHKLQETVCQCHERIHCLCSMETNKKQRKEKRNTHSPYKHKLHKTRKRTSVTSELQKKKIPGVLVRPMSQFKNKKKEKRKKGLEVHCCLYSTQSRTNKKKKKVKKVKKKKKLVFFQCKQHYLPK